MAGEKKISRRQAREQKKQLSSVSAPASINDQQFTWSATDVDHDYAGDWNWCLAPRETADLLCLLEELSKLTWREVKDQRTNSKSRTRALHHDQPTASICHAAQQRLGELQIDVDTMFRLRHGNLLRVWGYLQGPVFKLVWYDRHHKVYPTET